MNEKKKKLIEDIETLKDFLRFLDARKIDKKTVWRKKKNDTKS